MEEVKSDRFKLTVEAPNNRTYTFEGPGGEHAPEKEDSFEAERVVLSFLRHLVILNWKKEAIENAKKDEVKSEEPKVIETEIIK